MNCKSVINDIISHMEWAKTFWYDKSEDFRNAYDSTFYKLIKENNEIVVSFSELEHFIKNDINCGLYHVLSRKNSIMYFLEINKENLINDDKFKELYENKTYNDIKNNKKVSSSKIDTLYTNIAEYCSNNNFTRKIKDPIIQVLAD